MYTCPVRASASAKTAVDQLEKLAGYIEPKLKQVDHIIDTDAPMLFNFQYGGSLASELIEAAEGIKELDG